MLVPRFPWSSSTVGSAFPRRGVRLATLLLMVLLIAPSAAIQPPVADAASVGVSETLVSGSAHSCVLAPDGVVRCWGANNYGQLGDGTLTASAVAVAVLAAGGAPLTGVTALAAGANHTCARLTTGRVVCWGRNDAGQLGDGSTTRRPNPVTVQAANGTPLTGVTMVAAGASHTCARLSTGGARCWGSNSSGQLGDGSTTRRVRAAIVKASSGSALAEVKAIAAGATHTCVIAARSSSVRCWGANAAGQLGDGTTTRRLRATNAQSVGGATIAGAKSIALGSTHSCVVVGSTNAVRCWGANNTGQVGDGTTTRRTRAVPTKTSTGIALTGVATVTAGSQFTCARLASGAGRCWGANGSWQLGDGSATTRLRAVGVAGISAIRSMAAGASHVCVRAASVASGVACWGSNGSGQLGGGTTGIRAQATSVVALIPSSIVLSSDRDLLRPDGISTAAIRATVIDPDGWGVCGASITFAVSSGDVTVSPGRTSSDCLGIAGARVRASTSVGHNEVVAAVVGTPLRAVVTVDLTTGGSVTLTESPGVSVAVTVIPPAGSATTLGVGATPESAAEVALGSTLDVAVSADASAQTILLVDGLLATPTAPLAGPAATAAGMTTTHYTVPVTGYQELAAGFFELRPGIIQLSDETMALLTAVSEDGLTLEFGEKNSQLGSLSVGDIVVSTDERFPNKVRGRVTALETIGSVLRVTTTTAELPDVFGRLSMNFGSKLRDRGAAPTSLRALEPSVEASYSIGLPIRAISFSVESSLLGKEWITGSAAVKVDVPRLVGCWEWDWLTLKCAEVSVTGGVGASGELGFTKSFIDWWGPVMPKLFLAPVPIAPLVAIVPMIEVDYHVEAAINASLEWSWEASVKGGVRYYDGVGLTPVAEARSSGTGLLHPNVTAGVTASWGPVMRATLTIDAICGLGIELGLPRFEVEVQVLPERTWTASAGAEIAPAVACFFGHKTYDPGYALMAEIGHGYWGTPPTVTRPTIGTVTLSPTTVVTGRSVSISATASDPDGIAGAEYRIGSSGSWLPMHASDYVFGDDSETVLATFTAPSSAGSYPVCLRATDLGGYGSATYSCATLSVIQDQSVITGGVLTNITISRDLNCSVTHENSSTSAIFYSRTACGTFLAVGGSVYSPQYIPAGQPGIPWTAVSQVGSGTGTRSDPWLLTSTVVAGSSGMTVIERDYYVNGDPYWTISTTVVNGSGAPQDVILYRAADCYIGSDWGYGSANPATGAVRCVNDYTGRWLEWLPVTTGSHYYENWYDVVWDRISSQQEFPDTTLGSEQIDNGAGLSWRTTLGAGTSQTFTHRLQVIWPSSTAVAGATAIATSGTPLRVMTEAERTAAAAADK